MSVRTYPPAIQSVPGLMIPELVDFEQPISHNGVLLDAAGEKIAFMVQAPKTGSIRKIHWLPTFVTTATDTDVRIETIDAATGNPSGTLWAANTNGTQLAASITSGAWLTTTLTADASVTRGSSKIAIVIAPTGTPNYYVGTVPLYTGNQWLFPYTKAFAAAAWGNAYATAVLPLLALEYSDGSFAHMPLVLPALTLASQLFNSASTPDERGLKFKLAAPIRVSGVWLSTMQDNGDYEILLYDSDGSTVLGTISNDKDESGTTLTSTAFYTFPSSISLLKDTFYRLVIKPTTTSSVRVAWMTVNVAGLFDQTSGGQNFHWTERTDAGAWTDTTTKRPMMGLIIDGIQG